MLSEARKQILKLSRMKVTDSEYISANSSLARPLFPKSNLRNFVFLQKL